jgi:hypothetical protein
MNKEAPEPEGMKELIRVKIDIYGLTQEDIDFLRNESTRIISTRTGERITE